MQSELEDLCFAVLHPDCYKKLHSERNELWKRNVVSPVVALEADQVLGSCNSCDGNQSMVSLVVRGDSVSPLSLVHLR